MKTLNPATSRNETTERVLQEMKAWLDAYMTDDVDAFVLVLATKRSMGGGMFLVDTSHKTAASPNTIDRATLARITNRAILGRDEAVEHETRAALEGGA